MNKLQKMLTVMALMMASGGIPKVHGMIDMDALAMIESGKNPEAYNKKTKARGLYQITPICLKDYNKHNPKGLRFTAQDMYVPSKASIVAKWYLQDRIAAMLTWMGHPVTVQRILWAWNAGIGNVADGVMPEETREFINKYNKIARR